MTNPLFRFSGVARETSVELGSTTITGKSIGVSAVSTHAMDAYDKVTYALESPEEGFYWAVTWNNVSQVD